MYQKDLGRLTGIIAKAMKEYNPGSGWQKAEVEEWETTGAQK